VGIGFCNHHCSTSSNGNMDNGFGNDMFEEESEGNCLKNEIEIEVD